MYPSTGGQRWATLRSQSKRVAPRASHSSHRIGCVRFGTVHSTMPPDRSKRAHSRRTASGLSTYSRRLEATTASKLPDAKGRVRQPGSSRIQTTVLPSALETASRSICSEMSQAVTEQPRLASRFARFPVPQPRSSTFRPLGRQRSSSVVNRSTRPASWPATAYFADHVAAFVSNS